MERLAHSRLPQRTAAPPFLALLREAGVLRDIARGRRTVRMMAADHRGDGRPVMVLPGFLASDGSTAILRRALKACNYQVHGWGQGRNFGVRGDILERLDRRMDHIADGAGGRVTLVGWSLGGLIAREYAKHAPDRVAKVITLGSPFSGDIRANHAWRLYELINSHPVDQTPLAARLDEKPPVPTIALWSKKDGVVAPACARGLSHESDGAVEVACSHMGFVASPNSIAAILKAIDA